MLIFWRICLGATVVIFFLWIFDQNIPFAGTKIITYNFNKLHGSASELYPRDRVRNPAAEIQNQGRTIIEDPVYFDIRTRVAYEMARIRLRYKNQSGRTVSLGMRIPGAEWKNILARGARHSQDGAWEILEADFDLSQIPLAQNKYTFLISIPGLQYDTIDPGTVIVSSADITLMKKPLWLTL